MKASIYSLLSLVVITASCNMTKADRDNVYTEEILKSHAQLAEGVLLKAYSLLPGAVYMQDAGTDNAVANNVGNAFRLASTGSISSSNNAYGVWKSAYNGIAYTNHFIDNIVENVKWSSDDRKNTEYKKRLTAEARGLRAYFYMQLLEAHSGIGSNGELLGVPMILHSNESIYQVPIKRSSFNDCVWLIKEDLQYCIDNLPTMYNDAPHTQEDQVAYNEIYGQRYSNRMNGSIAMALKARLLYWAATPAYNLTKDPQKWADAADAAADIINIHGGLSGLGSDRSEYYLDETSSDILWRKDTYTGNNFENENFPPSLFGNGRLNPSQNLVNAFPTENGYPISTSDSCFSEDLPYLHRDPRLGKYIIYNGSIVKGCPINTINDSKDGVNSIREKSTRSGYYLRKFLDEKVNLATGSAVKTRHFVTLLRYTEAYLIFAECSFEALGIDEQGSWGYSSRDVLKALRGSAGITGEDQFLVSLTDAGEYRHLLQNERRIELCFEGFRYWDIRRHKDYNALKASVEGTADGGFTTFAIEDRKFEDYMIYGPIPNEEVQKGLEQNHGWK